MRLTQVVVKKLLNLFSLLFVNFLVDSKQVML